MCDAKSRSVTLDLATGKADIIAREAIKLYEQIYVPPAELRGIGITITRLSSAASKAASGSAGSGAIGTVFANVTRSTSVATVDDDTPIEQNIVADRDPDSDRAGHDDPAVGKAAPQSALVAAGESSALLQSVISTENHLAPFVEVSLASASAMTDPVDPAIPTASSGNLSRGVHVLSTATRKPYGKIGRQISTGGGKRQAQTSILESLVGNVVKSSTASSASSTAASVSASAADAGSFAVPLPPRSNPGGSASSKPSTAPSASSTPSAAAQNTKSGAAVAVGGAWSSGAVDKGVNRGVPSRPVESKKAIKGVERGFSSFGRPNATSASLVPRAPTSSRQLFDSNDQGNGAASSMQSEDRPSSARDTTEWEALRMPNFSQLDRDVVSELPLEIRRELAQAYQTKLAAVPSQPSPVAAEDSTKAAGTTTTKAVSSRSERQSGTVGASNNLKRKASSSATVVMGPKAKQAKTNQVESGSIAPSASAGLPDNGLSREMCSYALFPPFSSLDSKTVLELPLDIRRELAAIYKQIEALNREQAVMMTAAASSSSGAASSSSRPAPRSVPIDVLPTSSQVCVSTQCQPNLLFAKRRCFGLNIRSTKMSWLSCLWQYGVS